MCFYTRAVFIEPFTRDDECLGTANEGPKSADNEALSSKVHLTVRPCSYLPILYVKKTKQNNMLELINILGNKPHNRETELFFFLARM